MSRLNRVDQMPRSHRQSGTLRLAAISILLTVLVTGCGGAVDTSEGGGDVSATADNPIHWDYFTFVGINHPIAEYALEFAATVKERTDDRFIITVRPAGEMPYSATEAIRVVSEGSVQMADANGGFVGGDSKIAAMLGLPFLVQNLEEMEIAYAAHEPYITNDLNSYGVQVLYWYTWPVQNLWGRGEPVRSLEDFRGRKIRGTTSEQAVLIQLLGADPITLTTPEVPTAMQRGTMDAVMTAAFNILGGSWQAFLEWGYLPDINMAGPSYIIVNSQAYQALPEDARRVLDEVAAEFQARQAKEIVGRETGDQRILAEQHGLELFAADPAEIQALTAMMIDYWQKWAQESGPHVEEALAKVRQALGK